ncbi:MAG: sigma 54-interacting transcriptional regulator [Acidobacteriota bacterium]
MRGAGASTDEIYEAVLALSRAIAGHDDLESLLSGVGEALRRVVDFEYLMMTLHESGGERVRTYVLGAEGPIEMDKHPPLCPDEHPAGLVWRTQQPMVISRVEEETRWPGLTRRMLNAGLHAIVFVPLTAGKNRLGTLGFGCLQPFDPNPAELAFLERVASEFAVAVEAHIAKRQLMRERDRVRTLFDITNALVSKLAPDKLLTAISEQLSRVIRHDFAVLTLRNENTGLLDLNALHFTGAPLFQLKKTSIDPEGMPSGEALATGKPVVLTRADFGRYPSEDIRKFAELGFGSSCSIPLVTPNRTLGTLEIARLSDEGWNEDDVDLLVQAARQIAIAVENSIAYQELAEVKEKLATEKLYLEDELCSDRNIGNMIGEGPAFQSVLRSVQIVAPTPATVLILGETGTGKELVARAIHALSGRSRASFVKVNCAAIPSNLLESELFGHEKGAFTDAVGQKIGRFELADRGTLFLDEIGEMPLELQPKLLRAIQDQEFERVGGTRTIRVDVRFIVATNRDLKAMVDDNRFRADLYYRLHVFPLSVPPLRERREDIPLLAKYFVQKYAQRMKRPIDSIPAAALEALSRYDWPGNIRELQNVIERSVILTHGSVLAVAMPGSVAPQGRSAIQAQSQTAERERILRALRESNGIVGGPNGAAARLGLKRTTLQSRMRKYGISRQYR